MLLDHEPAVAHTLLRVAGVREVMDGKLVLVLDSSEAGKLDSALSQFRPVRDASTTQEGAWGELLACRAWVPNRGQEIQMMQKQLAQSFKRLEAAYLAAHGAGGVHVEVPSKRHSTL
jgi:hypothetical protein